MANYTIEKSPSDDLSLRNCAVVRSDDELASSRYIHVCVLRVHLYTVCLHLVGSKTVLFSSTSFNFKLSASSLFVVLSLSLSLYLSLSLSLSSVCRYIKVKGQYLTVVKHSKVGPRSLGLSGVQVMSSYTVYYHCSLSFPSLLRMTMTSTIGQG